MINNRPDERDSLFAAETLFTQLQAMLKETSGVRLADDPECLHRMRVASRRLRASMDLFGDFVPKKMPAGWMKLIRRVTKTLGAARDLDVQILALQEIDARVPEARFHAGIERLLLRLRQQRAQQQRRVTQVLDELEHGNPIRLMEETLRRWRTTDVPEPPAGFSPELLAHAEAAISGRLRDMQSYEVYIADPTQVANLHAMRIAAKRLRYSLQLLTPVFAEKPQDAITAARNIQDMLGDIHDCDVWVTMLPRFMEDERRRMLAYAGHTRGFARLQRGLDYLAEERSHFRAQRYAEFLDYWRKLKRQKIWEALRQMLLGQPDETGSDA